MQDKRRTTNRATTNPSRHRTANRTSAGANRSDAGNAPRRSVANAPDPRETHKHLAIGIGIVVAIVVAIIGGAWWQATRPITVTINGTEMQVSGTRTAGNAIEQSGISYEAGDLLDVTGGVIEEGGGQAFKLSINGNPSDDLETSIVEGDTIDIADGSDNTEAYTVDDNYTIERDCVEEGSGPVSKLTAEGRDGIGVAHVGTISGKALVAKVKKKPIDRVYTHYYPDVGPDKVICLTFDDGPVNGQTDKILTLLKKYDAKATFFTIGDQITGTGAKLVAREAKEGHQVCTHTWDHAADSDNYSLSGLSKTKQRTEITEGLAAIEDATGEEASTAFRSPGGNFPLKVWKNVDDLVSAEIGWTIDTEDWSKPGVKDIVKELKSAESGDIILMHDGGGDRTQTIKALKKALPYLVEQGYTFITIDELLEYPAAE